MGAVQKIVGGYLLVWLIAISSIFGMLMVSFILSIFTNEASMIQMMYFAYNGTISIFIILLGAPIGFAMVVLIPVWNAVNDFVAPLLAVILDPIVGAFSKIVGIPYKSFAVTGVMDQSAYGFVVSFRTLLQSFTDFLFTEVVG